MDVLKSLDTIFNPINYPSTKDGLRNHGQEELEFLIGYYGSTEKGIIDGDSLRNDFMYFKQIAFNFKSLNMAHFIKKIIAEYNNEFPEFAKLAKIASVLPISSADAERGFSAMKRIKTSSRNRISEVKLKQLMMISLQGPELSKFQEIITKANDIFHNNKLHRPSTSNE